MTDTIRELIQQNIDAVLKTITIANGYNNTVVSVQRWEQNGNSLLLAPCIIQVPNPEEKTEGPHPYSTCRLPIDIYIFVRHDKTEDSRATDAILNSLLGDIEKALKIDSTRGGNAENTIIKNNSFIVNEQGEPISGIIVEIEVVYYHQTTNPYSR